MVIFMEKIKKYFNLRNIIILLFIIYMWIFFYTRILNDSNELIVTIPVIIIFSIFLFIQILFFFLYKYIKKKKLEISKIYVILAFCFLPFYLFAFPQAQIPDEFGDYNRSLEISMGYLTSEYKGEKLGAGRELSTNIEKVFSNNAKYKDTLNVMDITLNKKSRFYDFANKSLYSFPCYIPQVLGITLGRIINIPIMGQIYLGRVFNYLLFVLLGYFSIKYLPAKKELALFIFLLPITLQEAISLSPDAITIGVSSLFVSMILAFRYNKDKMLSKKELFFLALLAIILSLCKIVYLPICFLLFLLPSSCFKSKKHKYIYTIFIISIATILNLIWLDISSLYLNAFHHRSNSSLQLEYIISNPLKYLATFINTLDVYLVNYLVTMVGGQLGPLTINTSTPIVIITLIILFYLIVSNNKKYFLNIKERVFMIIIVLIVVALVFTSIYMQWNSVENKIIEGIQGRYFIPLLLLLAGAFMSNKKNDMKLNNNLVLFIICANVMALIAVSTSFI